MIRRNVFIYIFTGRNLNIWFWKNVWMSGIVLKLFCCHFVENYFGKHTCKKCCAWSNVSQNSKWNGLISNENRRPTYFTNWYLHKSTLISGNRPESIRLLKFDFFFFWKICRRTDGQIERDLRISKARKKWIFARSKAYFRWECECVSCFYQKWHCCVRF